MIELVVRYVGWKAIKMLWRRKFPKLGLGELIEKRSKLKGEMERFIREGRYREAANHRGRILGVQMKITGLSFKEDKRIIKRECEEVKEQKKRLNKGKGIY